MLGREKQTEEISYIPNYRQSQVSTDEEEKEFLLRKGWQITPWLD